MFSPKPKLKVTVDGKPNTLTLHRVPGMCQGNEWGYLTIGNTHEYSFNFQLRSGMKFKTMGKTFEVLAGPYPDLFKRGYSFNYSRGRHIAFPGGQ